MFEYRVHCIWHFFVAVICEITCLGYHRFQMKCRTVCICQFCISSLFSMSLKKKSSWKEMVGVCYCISYTIPYFSQYNITCVFLLLTIQYLMCFSTSHNTISHVFFWQLHFWGLWNLYYELVSGTIDYSQTNMKILRYVVIG